MIDVVLGRFFILLILIAISGCGILETRHFQENETILSSLYLPDQVNKRNPELEEEIKALLSGERANDKDVTTDKENGSLQFSGEKLLIINNIKELDTKFLVSLKEKVLQEKPGIAGVDFFEVSSMPNLTNLRLIGARQGARYVLVLNSLFDVYRSHNGWTIPTIMGLGIPYFFLETQTFWVFVKIEYSLINVEESFIVSNDSVTAEALSEALLTEIGLKEHQTKTQTIEKGFLELSEKFIQKL